MPGGRPDLGVARRVEQILQKREPDILRQLRAIDTLEQIGTPAAHEVMDTLAKSTPTPAWHKRYKGRWVGSRLEVYVDSFTTFFTESPMRNLIAGLTLLALAGVGPAKTPKPAVDRYGDALPDGAIARLGTVRFRGGFSQKVAFGRTGRSWLRCITAGVVASGTNERSTSAPATRRLLCTRARFSADGKMLVAGLRLIDVATGKEVHNLKGHIKMIFRRVFAGRNDRCDKRPEGMGKIIFWDVKTGKKLLHTDERNANSSPTCLAFPGQRTANSLPRQDADKTVRIWDVATGKRVFRFEALKSAGLPRLLCGLMVNP